jgi:tRNA dimethylallyltransferase
MQRRLVAIVGPTATGKSAAAVALAERLGGEIVNADSRQVYRGMDIGTAKPTSTDRRRVPHHLYDIADTGDGFSLALYIREARAALERIWARGSFAWLVGGSGQYVWALLEDWNVPEVPPDEGFRQRLRDRADREGADSLHERLRTVDPVAAGRIDRNNVRRVIRALEVHEKTGRPISDWQTRGSPEFEYLLYGMDLPNSDLEPRISERVHSMFESGLVGEVQSLLAAGVDPTAPAMSAIGYREVVQLLNGEMDKTAAREAVALATRRLVRRQRQWFRRDDPRIRWVAGPDDIEMEANIFTGVCTNALRRSG